MLCQQNWNQYKETEGWGWVGGADWMRDRSMEGAWEHGPWLKGRKGSKGVFGTRVKIKQTFRRKKRHLIFSIKYKLNFNAERLLDLFYKWWCFDLEAQMDSLNSELCLALKVFFFFFFTFCGSLCQPLFNFAVIESPSMKITQMFDRAPPSYADPNWLSGWSSPARPKREHSVHRILRKPSTFPGHQVPELWHISWRFICRLNRHHLTSGCTKLPEGCALF